jgi:hypothetical protein
MKLRTTRPGLILLLAMFVVLGSRVAVADDSKQSSSDNSSQSTSSDNHSNDNQSNDNQSSDDQSNDNNGGVGSNVITHEIGESAEKEQEEARQAVVNGKAAPLTLLLKKLQTDYPGQILDVALTRKLAKLLFVVKYIDPTGTVKVVTLDALSLEVY